MFAVDKFEGLTEMNKWMKRRIERSRARCERAEEQQKQSRNERSSDISTNDTDARADKTEVFAQS
jgi:hypothetical protein